MDTALYSVRNPSTTSYTADTVLSPSSPDTRDFWDITFYTKHGDIDLPRQDDLQTSIQKFQEYDMSLIDLAVITNLNSVRKKESDLGER
jgi:hypothetical protein